MYNDIILVRGGGDIATGTIHKLYRSGFKILVLEVEKPTSIRRNVCFSEAVYDGYAVVQGVKAVLIRDRESIEKAWREGNIPVAVDSRGDLIKKFKPIAVVDAILAKRNMGTNKDMAAITIALGPGFEAGKDVDVVIETMRGHNLASLIFQGKAMKNTGIPGDIKGFSKERVIYSLDDGIIKNLISIGSVVKKREVLAYVGDTPIKATIDGLLRGIIKDGAMVTKGLKIADIDPRLTEIDNCNTISDKARNIAGGVLEALLYMKNLKGV